MGLTDLLGGPVVEVCWEVELQRAVVHREVELSAQAPHHHVVPVLVVQKTPHGEQAMLAVRGQTPACNTEQKERVCQILTIISCFKDAGPCSP